MSGFALATGYGVGILTVWLASAGGRCAMCLFQYASDPMFFFSPDLLLHKPEWLNGERGPDVSPHLTWYPIITCLQIAFDLPMATSVPRGYGHNYSPANYIDAWIAVTEPKNWTDKDTKRLNHLLAKQPVKK